MCTEISFLVVFHRDSFSFSSSSLRRCSGSVQVLPVDAVIRARPFIFNDADAISDFHLARKVEGGGETEDVGYDAGEKE